MVMLSIIMSRSSELGSALPLKPTILILLLYIYGWHDADGYRAVQPASKLMSNKRTDADLRREALWSFPREWRTMYFAVFIILCVGFGGLAAIEYGDRAYWLTSPFSSLTQVIIGTGTASGLLSLFVTEIGRAIVTFSTWLAEKLNENLEKGRERLRNEGRSEGIEYGRTIGLYESQGKQPPPPPWEKNGDEQSD